MDSLTSIYLTWISLCLVASGFFSLAETALTSLSYVQAERLSKSTGIFHPALKYWLDIPNRLLATNLLCNTLTNTAAAAIATSLVAQHYPDSSIGWATLLMTFFLLIFGEIGPKMVARAFPEKIAPFGCWALVQLHRIFYPITFAITRGVYVVTGAFGFILKTERKIKPEDIEQMVSLANKQGGLEVLKGNILASIFQFSKRRVKDIMIPRDKISALSVDADLQEVLGIIRAVNHSRYPVYREDLDEIVGFLHARDLFSYLKRVDAGHVSEDFTLSQYLRKAFFISDHALVSQVLNDMKRKRVHLAIVKNEWGNVMGLVTLEDILEEVFGEIDDEHDDQSEINKADLVYTGVEVEGTISLLDLKSKYDINLEPTESYTTINGMLHHLALDQQLVSKMIIIKDRLVFTILDVKDGEVLRVRITQLPASRS